MLLVVHELPETSTAARRVLNCVIDQVAHRLGNTRAVCRKCYVHPLVIQSWEAGTLAAEIHAVRRSFRKPLAGLDDKETVVLRWLSKAETAKDGASV